LTFDVFFCSCRYDSNAPDSTDSEGGSDHSGKEKKEKKPKKAKTISEKPRKKREKGDEKRKKKDENAPKRPQSAYFLWMNESRESIKEKNPGASVAEIAKKAGEMWRELKDKTVRINELYYSVASINTTIQIYLFFSHKYMIFLYHKV